jgi:archaellum biogenesis ATPase FlaH
MTKKEKDFILKELRHHIFTENEQMIKEFIFICKNLNIEYIDFVNEQILGVALNQQWKDILKLIPNFYKICTNEWIDYILDELQFYYQKEQESKHINNINGFKNIIDKCKIKLLETY